MAFLLFSGVVSASQISDIVSESNAPKKSAAWDIEGGAIFFKPSINDMRDTNARTWYHLRAPFSNTYQNLAGTFTTIDMSPQWDAANLEFGRQIVLDEKDNIRLHAGIQYARVSVGVTDLTLLAQKMVLNYYPLFH